MSFADTTRCLICKRPRQTLYWHRNPKSGDIWVHCHGVCQRSYSLHQYCVFAGVSLSTFLKGSFDFKEVRSNEINVKAWPSTFISLSDPRAGPGVEYVQGRGLNLDGNLYYDLEREGIVFPYYFKQHFCGAQIRFLKERVGETSDIQKITTLPDTRTGMLFGAWNQDKFQTNVNYVIVTEGYFNALSLQQCLDRKAGGITKTPWKVICTSSCHATHHHQEVLQELIAAGVKVVGAYDADTAGSTGTADLKRNKCITHCSSTGIAERDWNDVLREEGADAVAKLFLSNLAKL